MIKVNLCNDTEGSLQRLYAFSARLLQHYFADNNFFRRCFDAVHQANPFHRIICFERFGSAFGSYHCLNELRKPCFCFGFGFGAMLIQCAVEQMIIAVFSSIFRFWNSDSRGTDLFLPLCFFVYICVILTYHITA